MGDLRETRQKAEQKRRSSPEGSGQKRRWVDPIEHKSKETQSTVRSKLPELIIDAALLLSLLPLHASTPPCLAFPELRQ